MRHLRKVSLGTWTMATAVAVGISCAITLAILVSAVHNLHHAGDRTAQSVRAVALTTHIEQTILQASADERGFIATSNPRFLGGFDAVSLAHDHDLALMRPLMVGSEVKEIGELDETINRLIFGWVMPQIALAYRDPVAAQKLEAGGTGLRREAAVLKEVKEVIATESALTARRRSEAAAAARRTTLIAIGGFSTIMLIALAYVAFLRRSIVRPVRAVLVAMNRVGSGDLSPRTPGDGIAEIGELERGFNGMADAIVENRGASERASAALAAEKESAVRLFGLAALLAGETDVRAAAETVVDRMSEAGSAEVAVLYGYDEQDDGRLHLLAARGVDPARLEAVLPAAKAEAIARGGSLDIEFAPGTSLTHELQVSLLHGSRLLGVVVLGCGGARDCDERTKQLLGYMADQSALAFGSILAYARAVRLGSLNETLIESSRDGIRLLDLDGAVLAQNKRMTELVARAAGFNPGRTFWEQAAAIAPRTTDPARFRAMTERIAAEPEAELGFEYEIAETGQVLSRFVAPVRGPAGSQTGRRIVILRDVTAERQAQRMKDDFVASVTHELRTPLTSISGYLELLLQGDAGDLTDDQQHFLHVVDRNASRLLGLVNDLLFVGRLESGMLALEPVPTDLAALLADAVEAATPAAEAQGVAVELSARSVPELFADRFRIAQLVDNLLSNAVKFTPAGGRVSISAACDGGKVVMLVSDSGIGVPDDEKPRLFDRFFRASTAVEQAVPGTGLGLAITKAIAEAHGGTISVEDTPGGGTTFRVELPLVLSQTKAAA